MKIKLGIKKQNFADLQIDLESQAKKCKKSLKQKTKKKLSPLAIEKAEKQLLIEFGASNCPMFLIYLFYFILSTSQKKVNLEID